MEKLRATKRVVPMRRDRLEKMGFAEELELSEEPVAGSTAALSSNFDKGCATTVLCSTDDDRNGRIDNDSGSAKIF